MNIVTPMESFRLRAPDVAPKKSDPKSMAVLKRDTAVVSLRPIVICRHHSLGLLRSAHTTISSANSLFPECFRSL